MVFLLLFQAHHQHFMLGSFLQFKLFRSGLRLGFGLLASVEHGPETSEQLVCGPYSCFGSCAAFFIYNTLE